MTTPSDSSATPVNAGPAGPVLRAVVLLRTTPPGVGAVLDLLLPDLSPQIRDLPLNRLTVTVNDVAVTFEVAAGPLVARELDYAVRQSPLRDLVQAAVAQHEGFLVLSADSGEDIFRASELLANVAATYAKDDNGLAVWLPDADHVTTDVMYVGEVAQRSAQTWFHTMAARMDETSSIAHTIGVHHLGGGDVQLRTVRTGPSAAAGSVGDRRTSAGSHAAAVVVVNEGENDDDATWLTHLLRGGGARRVDDGGCGSPTTTRSGRRSSPTAWAQWTGWEPGPSDG